MDVSRISHDTKCFRVSLDSPSDSTGLVVSSLVMVKGAGEEARPYTPITLKEELGHFDLMVKAYPNGVVSQYLHQLEVGDKVDIKGPFKKLSYSPNMKKQICMLAGGTGITPCLQVIKEIARLGDKTDVRLLFANHAEEDILLRNILQDICEKHENINVQHILSKPSDTWEGLRGRINRQILEQFLPPPSSDTLVYVCGPPAFMKDVCSDKLPNKEQGPLGGYLKDLGFTENMVYKF